MKKKWGLAVLGFVFVAMIGAAGILYNKYSGEVEGDRLITTDSSQTEFEKNEIEENSTQQAPDAADEAAAEETEPVMAPDFTVYDEEGNAVNLSDFIGKPTVVNFWASWCGPCKMEMPDFDEKYAELGEEVHFLMVNMTDGSQETKETAKEFLESSGYTFPVYYDTDMDAARTYGVNAVPSTYFIDAEGHAIAVAQGMIDAATLQAGIDMLTRKNESQ